MEKCFFGLGKGMAIRETQKQTKKNKNNQEAK